MSWLLQAAGYIIGGGLIGALAVVTVGAVVVVLDSVVEWVTGR